MATPALLGAGVAVIEAEIVLCPQEVFLDGLSQIGSASEFGERRFGLEEDHTVCRLSGSSWERRISS